MMEPPSAYKTLLVTLRCYPPAQQIPEPGVLFHQPLLFLMDTLQNLFHLNWIWDGVFLGVQAYLLYLWPGRSIYIKQFPHSETSWLICCASKISHKWREPAPWKENFILHLTWPTNILNRIWNIWTYCYLKLSFNISSYYLYRFMRRRLNWKESLSGLLLLSNLSKN